MVIGLLLTVPAILPLFVFGDPNTTGGSNTACARVAEPTGTAERANGHSGEAEA